MTCCYNLLGRLINRKLSLMENEVYIEQHVPSGVLKSIRFKVLSEEDAEKASVQQITCYLIWT